MRAYIGIRMNRLIKKEHDHISMGGFDVVTGSNHYYFEFCTSYGTINELDPSIIEFELRDEEFIDLREEGFIRGIEPINDHLHEITKLEEAYVYSTTNLSKEPDICPVDILYLRFTDYGKGKREEFPVSNDNVKCTCYETDHDWQIDYDLSDSIIQEYINRADEFVPDDGGLYELNSLVSEEESNEAIEAFGNGDSTKLDAILDMYYDWSLRRLVAVTKNAIKKNDVSLDKFCNKDGSITKLGAIMKRMEENMNLGLTIKQDDTNEQNDTEAFHGTECIRSAKHLIPQLKVFEEIDKKEE